MVAWEVRDYRNGVRKCIEGEARAKLMEELVKKGLGLRDVEEFVSKAPCANF